MAPVEVLDLVESELGVETLEEQLEREAWLRGDLSYLLKPGAQTVAYEFIERWERVHPGHPGPIVIHMHRGSRKTALSEIHAIERCIRYPGHIERLGFPTAKNAHEATSEFLPKVLARAPAELKPRQVGDELHFRNPRWEDPDAVSVMVIFGCREGAKGQRNLRSNGISLDEFREIDRPEYVVEHVLSGHFVHKDRPLMVVYSTSPKTPGHYFWTLVEAARRDGRYLIVPTTENPDFSEQDERVLVALCGGKGTPAWKREALCEKVADETLLAIPSFYTKRRAAEERRDRGEEAPDPFVMEWKRPEFFFPFITGDMGFIDCAAFLFFYIDYLKKKMVIEDEIVGSSIGSVELRERIKRRELELFGKTALYSQIRRWADATPRELDDLRDHGRGVLFTSAKTGPEKWDKWQGLAHLESLCAQERIVISPRATCLIYQLENAMKNKWHTDLEREPFEEGRDPLEPVMGHADALWACAYGAWQARYYWDQSPYPPAANVGRPAWAFPGTPAARAPTIKTTSEPITITHETRHIHGIVKPRKQPGVL